MDAFYVCLYSEADKALFFAYNVDGDVYDVPVTLPLGHGPTSRAVRSGCPVVVNDRQEACLTGLIPFGQMERISRAAVHVPIRAQDAKTDARTVLGVLSAHTYGPDPYTPEAVAALQRLADRAGVALTRERDEAAWRYRLRAADALEADRLRPLVEQAEAFVAMLQRLGGQIEALRPLLPPGDAALAAALTALHRQCCEAQTRANQLPLRPDLSPLTSPCGPARRPHPHRAHHPPPHRRRRLQPRHRRRRMRQRGHRQVPLQEHLPQAKRHYPHRRRPTSWLTSSDAGSWCTYPNG